MSTPALLLRIALLMAPTYLAACKTGVDPRPDDHAQLNAPIAGGVVQVVPVEGLDVTELITRDALTTRTPYGTLSMGTANIAMAFYSKTWVELDGKAPAELIVSMIPENLIDASRDDANSMFIPMLHAVYQRQDDGTWHLITTLMQQSESPALTTRDAFILHDLNRDGRQELLIHSGAQFASDRDWSVRLFSLEGGELRDRIWGTPHASSLLALDMDQDGADELILLPGILASYDVSATREPTALKPGADGLWRSTPLTLSEVQWRALAITAPLADAKHIDFTLLCDLGHVLRQRGLKLDAAQHQLLIARFVQLIEPLDRARFLISAPWSEVASTLALTTAIIEDSNAPLITRMAALAALARLDDSEEARQRILDAMPDVRAELAALPADTYGKNLSVYREDLRADLAGIIHGAFLQHGDDRLVLATLEEGAEGLQSGDDLQAHLDIIMELYSVQTGPREEFLTLIGILAGATHRAIQRGEMSHVLLLGEVLAQHSLYGLDGHPPTEDTTPEAQAYSVFVAQQRERLLAGLPIAAVMPLVEAPEPDLRRFALHHISATQPALLSALAERRLLVEQDELVLPTLISLLIAPAGEELPAHFWQKVVLRFAQTPHWANISHLPMSKFGASATPDEAIALLGALPDPGARADLLWAIAHEQGDRLSSPAWSPLRQHLISRLTAASDSGEIDSLARAAAHIPHDEVQRALLDRARNETREETLVTLLLHIAVRGDVEALNLFDARLQFFTAADRGHLRTELVRTISLKNSPFGFTWLEAQLPSLNDIKAVEAWAWLAGKLLIQQDIPPSLRVKMIAHVDLALATPDRDCMELSIFYALLLVSSEPLGSLLARIEAHPSCVSDLAPYLPQLLTLGLVSYLAHQSPTRHDRMLTLARQHLNSPHRELRVKAIRAEQALLAPHSPTPYDSDHSRPR